MGALLRALLGERRRIALRNLELCFPGLDVTAREALLREHFRPLAIGVFEFARAWWGSVDPLRRGIEVEGLEPLAAARAGWRGVIVVSGHFPTLQVSGRLMSAHLPLPGLSPPPTQPPAESAVPPGPP